MKKLFAKLFKQEPPPNYVMAEFHPIKVDHLHRATKVTEFTAGDTMELEEKEFTDGDGFYI
jgi:hypothetical protein